jgi:hypothetical protein
MPLLLACLLAAGCRQDPYLDAHIEILNAAKRSLEDRVYELEYEDELKQDQLDRLREENERLRQQLKGAPADLGREPDPEPFRIEMPPAEPSRELDIGPEQLRPPRVEDGIPTDPSIEIPSRPRRSSSTRRSPGPALSSTTAAPTLDLTDPRIAKIRIHAGFIDAGTPDGSVGDEGLTVIVEPLNEQGAFVPLAGPLSVVVLDPSAEGEQKRVARWDLDAVDVDREMRRSADAQGIQLMLGWPDKTPQRRQLHVFVRYETADGRKLEADQPLIVDESGTLSQQWSPRVPPETSTPDEQPTDEPPVDIARPEWTPYR